MRAEVGKVADLFPFIADLLLFCSDLILLLVNLLVKRVGGGVKGILSRRQSSLILRICRVQPDDENAFTTDGRKWRKGDLGSRVWRSNWRRYQKREQSCRHCGDNTNENRLARNHKQ